jgi:hypothetical protein
VIFVVQKRFSRLLGLFVISGIFNILGGEKIFEGS